MITNIIYSAICTVYVSTGKVCANGHYPRPLYTVAAPRSIPLGTKVCANGQMYVCEDRTNIRYDGRWDIFVDCSRNEALKIGKQTNNITIITK
jgi:3D (Asp-Asp-Asp) domain-containing protein